MAKIIGKIIITNIKIDNGEIWSRNELINEKEIFWSKDKSSVIRYKICLWHDEPIWFEFNYNTQTFSKMMSVQPEYEIIYQKLLRSDKLERILKDE